MRAGASLPCLLGYEAGKQSEPSLVVLSHASPVKHLAARLLSDVMLYGVLPSDFWSSLGTSRDFHMVLVVLGVVLMVVGVVASHYYD